MLSNPHRRKKEPVNGAFGFLMKESRSLQEVHVVCNAKAHSLIRKAKWLAMKPTNSFDVLSNECKEAHT